MNITLYRRKQLIRSLSRHGFTAFNLEKITYKEIKFLDTKIYNENQIIVKGNVEVEFDNDTLTFGCIIFFSDSYLIDLPQVYLIAPIPNKLLLPVPHIWTSAYKYDEKDMQLVCISLSNVVTIDRFDPDKLIRFIIGQLIFTLTNVLDPNSLEEELRNDIYPLWIALERNQPARCNGLYFSKLPTNNSYTPFTVISSDNKNSVLNGCISHIPDDAKVPNMHEYFPTNMKGVLLQNFLNWIKRWHPPAYINFFESLKKYTDFDKSFFKGFIYRKQVMYISVKFDQLHVTRIIAGINLKHIGFKGIQGLGFGVGDIIQFDRTVARNLTNLSSNQKPMNLKNKRILQIGCGAIGGYLSDALVKIGAGIGEGSELHLIDYDLLKVENLGRHFLSTMYLGINKTKAMELYLRNAYAIFLVNENLNISTSEFNIVEKSIYFFQSFDLIIDATGKSEVAQFLNEIVRSLPPDDQVPLLNLWIFANGECVQGFWNDPQVINLNGGCYHCLMRSWADDPSQFTPIANFEPEKTKIVEQPCSAFTPYAISASMNAASLAIELILSAQSNPLTENYFTRYSSSFKYTHLAPSLLLTPHPKCPLCSKRAT